MFFNRVNLCTSSPLHWMPGKQIAEMKPAIIACLFIDHLKSIPDCITRIFHAIDFGIDTTWWMGDTKQCFSLIHNWSANEKCTLQMNFDQQGWRCPWRTVFRFCYFCTGNHHCEILGLAPLQQREVFPNAHGCTLYLSHKLNRNINLCFI